MTKQQVLLIHGGTTFDSYDAYLTYLKRYPLERILDQRSGWKDSFDEQLGASFDVIYPSMPRNYSVQYPEWKIWMEKYVPLLHDDIILIGHSLGGTFLLKYMSENAFPVSVKALILIAPAYEDTTDESLGSFRFMLDAKRVQTQCAHIVIYHSRDDKVVPYADIQKLSGALPDAQVQTFTGRGHFISPEFPELSAHVKTLATQKSRA